MNYICLYIKRTFTRNVKKQLFLVMGIAAFMTMLAEHVMRADAREREAVEQSEWNDMGFSVKLPDISLEEIEFIEKHPETEYMSAVEKIKVSGGLRNAEYIVSAAVPDTWNITYLYGGEPEHGEIVLTENTLIGSRQPMIGESIQIEVMAGEEKKVLEATVAGVVKSFLEFTGGYVFLYPDDFLALTETLSTEERRYDVFLKTIYEEFEEGELWLELYERYGVASVVGLEEGMINKKYDLGELVCQIVIAAIVAGGCLAGIIYMILQDEKKNIGILRALGAQKFQIAIMVTVRVLLSGVLGILLGSGLTAVAEKIKNQLTYTKTGEGSKTGGIAFAAIFLGGLAVLLLLQLPALV